MITFQTPLGPVELPAELADAIRAALQQRYDDGLQAGYDQARREEQARMAKRPVRPVFLAVDLGALDLDLAA